MSTRAHPVDSAEPWAAALASGEDPARVFEAFVQAEGEYVLGVVQRFLSNADDARDVTQDALLRALSALQSFRGECTLRTWVTRIALHQAQRRLRRRRLHTAILGLFSSAHRTPASAPVPMAADKVVELQGQADALGRALATLPPRQALVFSLRFQEGLALPEIAALLRVEPATVKTHLTRALARVRAQWPPSPKSGGTSS